MFGRLIERLTPFDGRGYRMAPAWETLCALAFSALVIGAICLLVGTYSVLTTDEPRTVEMNYQGIERANRDNHGVFVFPEFGVQPWNYYEIDWWMLKEFYEDPTDFADWVRKELVDGEPLILHVVGKRKVLGLTGKVSGMEYLSVEETYPIYVNADYKNIRYGLAFVVPGGILLCIALKLRQIDRHRCKRRRRAVRH